MSPSDENPMTIATRNPLTEIFDRLGEKLPLCAAFSNKQAICGRPPRYAPTQQNPTTVQFSGDKSADAVRLAGTNKGLAPNLRKHTGNSSGPVAEGHRWSSAQNTRHSDM